MRRPFRRESAFSRVYAVGFDQIISSVSNFLILWVFLSNSSTAEFGVFSFSWGVIALFISLSRALFGLPSLLDSHKSSDNSSELSQTSLAGALILGMSAMLVSTILYTFGDPSAQTSWMFGLFFISPLILIHDQLRYIAIASLKPLLAIRIDFVVFAFVATVSIASFSIGFSGWYAMAGLGAGYVIALLSYAKSNFIGFSFKSTLFVIRDDFKRRAKLLSDALLIFLFGVGSLVLLRSATGDDGIGTYNGLLVLFGPVTLVSVFLTIGLQSEISRTSGFLSVKHRSALFGLALTPLLWLLMIQQTNTEVLSKLLGSSTEVVVNNASVFAVAAALSLIQEILNLFMRTREKFGSIAAIRLLTGVTSLFILTIGVIKELDLNTLIIGLWIPAVIGIVLTSLTLGKPSKLSPLNPSL